MPEMIYDFKTGKFNLLADGVRAMPYQQKASEMSSRQRKMIVDLNVEIRPVLGGYLFTETTNRVREYLWMYDKMIVGKIPLNIFLLRDLLKGVEWEMVWRTK